MFLEDLPTYHLLPPVLGGDRADDRRRPLWGPVQESAESGLGVHREAIPEMSDNVLGQIAFPNCPQSL